MSSEKLHFRNYLAEHGVETTPEHAGRIYDLTKKIMKNVGTMSLMELWALEEELNPEELEIFNYIRSRVCKIGENRC
jgi:hypothetical protein